MPLPVTSTRITSGPDCTCYKKENKYCRWNWSSPARPPHVLVFAQNNLLDSEECQVTIVVNFQLQPFCSSSWVHTHTSKRIPKMQFAYDMFCEHFHTRTQGQSKLLLLGLKLCCHNFICFFQLKTALFWASRWKQYTKHLVFCCFNFRLLVTDPEHTQMHTSQHERNWKKHIKPKFNCWSRSWSARTWPVSNLARTATLPVRAHPLDLWLLV